MPHGQKAKTQSKGSAVTNSIKTLGIGHIKKYLKKKKVYQPVSELWIQNKKVATNLQVAFENSI